MFKTCLSRGTNQSYKYDVRWCEQVIFQFIFLKMNTRYYHDYIDGITISFFSRYDQECYVKCGHGRKVTMTAYAYIKMHKSFVNLLQGRVTPEL